MMAPSSFTCKTGRQLREEAAPGLREGLPGRGAGRGTAHTWAVRPVHGTVISAGGGPGRGVQRVPVFLEHDAAMMKAKHVYYRKVTENAHEHKRKGPASLYYHVPTPMPLPILLCQVFNAFFSLKGTRLK